MSFLPLRLSPLALALLALLLFLLPGAWLGSHTYCPLDDTLDSEMGYLYLVNHYHVVFDYRPSTVLPAVMNGLPRNALRQGLNVTTGLFALVQAPWAAYLVQQALVRLAGLLTMYALLVAPVGGRLRAGPAAALALAWATLPAYTIYGLTVLGQPLLLLAFLTLRQGRGRWGWPWLAIGVFGLWSWFALVGAFALAVGLAGLLWDWQRTRHLNRRVALGLALLLGCYVLAEWPVFYSLAGQQFVPHRLEFDLRYLKPMGVLAALKSATLLFLVGQYHAGQFARVALALAAVGVLACAPAGQRAAVARRFGPGLLALAALALLGGFYPQLVVWGQRYWPVLGVFNGGRFYFLGALLCFWLLAQALRGLPRRWAMAVLAVQLGVGLAANREWTNNLRELAGRPRPQDPSYRAYVAPELFRAVQAAIRQRRGLEPPQYRVACLGLVPSVAQLNGFYTLDSYQNYYPLAYKHRFRPLIAGELQKSPALRHYFDDWGSRCYLFAAELGRNFQAGAYQHRVVQHWAFNAPAFRQMGGRYVLSAAQLATPAASGLQLAGVFARPGAYWRIWLYEVR